MAHWAEIDDNNIVIRVTVGDNNDPNGDEGHKWLVDNLGGTWVKTSYNANFGKKFAGIGDTYVASTGNFKPPQPFESWRWNATKWTWIAPEDYPTDGKPYSWDETTRTWIEIENG
jgi:hypothetical protein